MQFIRPAILVLALVLSLLPAATTVGQEEDQHLPFTVNRLAGDNRFGTAAAVSAAAFQTADTVYIAPGGDHRLALAGGARAARDNAPLLLVEQAHVPEETSSEVERLGAQHIVLLGGEDDISADVEAVLSEQATVRRLAGTDITETIALIARDGWQPDESPVIYLATDAAFPDSLAGGAAGAVLGGPVLEVSQDMIPPATAAALEDLIPQTVRVLGGPAAVSQEVMDMVGDHTQAPVRRLGGLTRIETAVAVSTDTHLDGTAVDVVYLATAYNHPDALAAAPAVAATNGALLLTAKDCVPLTVRDEIARLAPDEVRILGGPAAVGPAVDAFMPCQGLPPAPTIEVSEIGGRGFIDDPGGYGERRIASLVGDGGSRTEFVEDELLVRTNDPAVLAGVLADTGGTVVNEIDGFGRLAKTHVIKLPPASTFAQADIGDLGPRLQWMNSTATGRVTLDAVAGLQTLDAAVTAVTSGVPATLNFITQFHDLADRDIRESNENGFPPGDNPFLWPEFRENMPPATGTAEAWRMLHLAGLAGNTVDIAIIDQGFAATNPDYPPDTYGKYGTANTSPCGGGGSCPWHGTHVTLAAAGEMDNQWAAVGAGAPVARIHQFPHAAGIDSLLVALPAALGAGVDIINMSFGMPVHWTGTVFVAWTEPVTAGIFDGGVLLVASAGNAGVDVDEETCFVVCWEEEWHFPCENAGVLCVGGLAQSSYERASQSNYGNEWCDHNFCDVDIFAPFSLWMGVSPDTPGNGLMLRSGTSYSAPYISGVAALILAAAPQMSPSSVIAQLYNTARVPGTPLVGRVVNTKAAITPLLPPEQVDVTITTPTEGQEFFYNGLNVTEPEATIGTVYSDPPELSWRMRRGTGPWTQLNPTQPLSFPQPGQYTIRADADYGDCTPCTDAPASSDSVMVTAVNDEPAVTMTKPDPRQRATTYYRGMSATLQASAADQNHPLGFPCENITWSLDAAPLATGCNPVVAFNTVGTYTLRVTAADEYGLTDSRDATIRVVEPPETGPPLVTITSPQDGQLIPPNQPTTVSADAQDPDGEPMTFAWTATYDGGTVAIGDQQTFSWTPTDSGLPHACSHYPVTVKVAVTAAGQTTTDQVDLSIAGTPC